MASARVAAAAPPAAAFFGRAAAVYGAAAALRVVLLVYGLWQDAHSPVKYTDIDYLVFTDAARAVAAGQPPYVRETYRYTPLLAWLLLPTAAADSSAAAVRLLPQLLFASGKLLFAAADLVAGYLLERVLRQRLGAAAAADTPDTPDMPDPTVARCRLYASVWLLNPMVAAISTRGSAEGLLGALVAALLWAVQVARRPALAGLLLGLGVHLKIYPFVYAPALIWWMDADEPMAPTRGQAGPVQGRASRQSHAAQSARVARSSPSSSSSSSSSSAGRALMSFLTPARLQLTFVSLVTFAGLNMAMYALYGFPFLQHTYLHHVTRIDHRHNFSPYNTQLYLSSAADALAANGSSSLPSLSPLSSLSSLALPPVESLAFVPQLLLATVLLPLVLAKKDLPTTLLAQTFAFVTFNKVCTSQYFLWYMVLLPVYLPRSSFVRTPRKGLAALALWVAGQAAWLQQGYELEFLGRSTFVPGLWLASLGFFLVNCWILGVMIDDAAAV